MTADEPPPPPPTGGAQPPAETPPAEAPPAPPPPATEAAPPPETEAAPPPAAEAPPPTEVPPPPVVAEPTSPSGRSYKGLKVLSWLVIAAGIILIAAGAFTWFVVRDQLGDEKITVSEDADHFAGDKVDGPLTAYSQAETINKHALDASGGKTYAQLDQDDPVRQTVMTASFLRASLFTSVVSFGVAAFAAGMGVLMLIIGYALLRIAGALSSLRSQAVAVT
jgi:hypothetical protein